MAMKKLKLPDIFLFLALLGIAAVSLIFFKNDGDADYLSVSRSGEQIMKIPLSESGEYLLRDDSGYNIVVVENGRAYMSTADCPDKYCVHKGEIYRVGQSIICLPHKLVIEIKSELNEVEVDGIAG